MKYSGAVSAIDDAFWLAESALAVHLPDRWLHVQSVARLAEELGLAVAGLDSDALLQAAWLHDIGYSPLIAQCGFHPLDGATHLTSIGIADDIVALVANHSAAAIEAQLRGIDGLKEYKDDVTPTRDALWYCDALTGPRGERWTATQRWLEIRQRYGEGHLVTRFLDEAQPSLLGAVTRTARRVENSTR